MNINLEALDLVPKLFELMQKIDEKLDYKFEKRWLSVNEVSNYLPFSKDKIYKMIDIQFIEGEHFIRKENKLIFDKEKLDEWVLYTPVNNENHIRPNEVVNDVLTSLAS